jgi:16S rRNA processing protein RimM
MRASDRLILMGVFGAPQGVSGQVRVRSYTHDPLSIGAYGALTDAKATRWFALEALRRLKDDMVVARIKGVTTREAAQALTGVELFARREQLPPPNEDEFYYDDLVGLAAMTPEGTTLGRVIGISNYGAGDILEIAGENQRETLLFPFSRAVATEIDFAGGRIVVVPPDEIEGGDEERG